MFKAVIVDDNEEYSFPFISEKYLLIKRIILLLLLVLLGYLITEPPLSSPDIKLVIKDAGIPERINKFGMSGLHRAVIKGNVRVVKILIRNGAGLDRTDKYGWSPLHWANFLGRRDLSELLILNGARRDIRSTADWFVFKSGSLPEEVKREH